MPRKLSKIDALAVFAAALMVAVTIFLPWWGLTFFAPQYPEGLRIIVYPYKMVGRIDIINGLNHYIGMQPFSEDTFPELRYLPAVIGALAGLTLIAAIVRRAKLLYVVIGVYIIGGLAGIWDIYRWLSRFGLNLDPRAPIHIKPFIPPILGANRIANFVTHSYFTYGSILLGLAFLLLLAAAIHHRKSGKRP